MPPPYLPNHVSPTSSHSPKERGYYEREIVAGYPDDHGDIPTPNSTSNRTRTRNHNRNRNHTHSQPQLPPTATVMTSSATARTRSVRTHTRSPIEEVDSYQHTGILPDGREFSIDHHQPHNLIQEEKQRVSLRRDERREHYHPAPMPPPAPPTSYRGYRSERVPHSEASRYGVPIPTHPYPPQPSQEQLPLNSRSRRDERFEREGNAHAHVHAHTHGEPKVMDRSLPGNSHATSHPGLSSSSSSPPPATLPPDPYYRTRRGSDQSVPMESVYATEKRADETGGRNPRRGDISDNSTSVPPFTYEQDAVEMSMRDGQTAQHPQPSQHPVPIEQQTPHSVQQMQGRMQSVPSMAHPMPAYMPVGMPIHMGMQMPIQIPVQMSMPMSMPMPMSVPVPVYNQSPIAQRPSRVGKTSAFSKSNTEAKPFIPSSMSNQVIISSFLGNVHSSQN